MITINQLRENSMRYIDSQSVALIYLLKVIDECLVFDHKTVIYPKNLYCRDKSLILYIFTSDYQLIRLSYDAETVSMITRDLNHLIKSQYLISNQESQHSLMFEDEIIYLYPKMDTTSPYVKEFNSQLILICKYLQEKGK